MSDKNHIEAPIKGFETCSSERPDTARQFEEVKSICRDIYVKKLHDYGTSWRVMRPSSLTDQILIKACRIRSIEEKGHHAVAEGIKPEFIGIVNYCTIALIQLQLGTGESLPIEEAVRLYEEKIEEATGLMEAKNHDYDEAWRMMRVSSFTDIILQKLMRTKEIESHDGITLISEGVAANYMDMMNYALFALIKLTYGEA